ncbi:hypothetical protein [Streptomyces sp. CJ_13]|nr:hypothetical protein [Streptomyces sp. CJ_13]
MKANAPAAGSLGPANTVTTTSEDRRDRGHDRGHENGPRTGGAT